MHSEKITSPGSAYTLLTGRRSSTHARPTEVTLTGYGLVPLPRSLMHHTDRAEPASGRPS